MNAPPVDQHNGQVLPQLPNIQMSDSFNDPPPKLEVSDPSGGFQAQQILTLPPSTSFDAAPLTPTTPISPSTPSSQTKKSNPLNDLIDTEKAYVDHLTGIIRKVAAAWSRSNLPPPELDKMFRSIEAVYKANRTLHSKLKDIGANPSSPKALGDLLMRWIDDLEAPYTAYCTKYCFGFDTWEPVQSNPRLSSTLATFSASNPPLNAALTASSDSPTWTLDALFLLPKARLKYYRKLYSRLLKSTAPGRSDHRLLVGALDTLDRLLDILESRSSLQVGESSPSVPAVLEMEDEVVIDMRSQSAASNPRLNEGDAAQGSESGSNHGSTFSGGERLSRETASTSISRGSSATLSMPISDLERRLVTHRTLDIFTMKPKVVKLQMTPPSLTFTREMRLSSDVLIRFTPRATGVEVVHHQGHIFLLSDLFLVCDRMSPQDQSQPGLEGADMWLCYPPLAGKVLRVSEVAGRDNALEVAIMRKEHLILETRSREQRDSMIARFKECIEFSGSLPPPSKQPPPPVPPLNGIPRSITEGGIAPTRRSSSPHAGGLPLRPQPPPAYQGPDASRITEDMSRLQMSPENKIQLDLPRQPPIHSDQPPPPPHLRPSASAHAFTNSPSTFGPPNAIPPVRSASFSPNGPLPSSSYNPNPVGSHSPQPFNPGPPGPGHPRFNGQQHPFPINPTHRSQSPYGPGGLPPRPPSDPSLNQNGVRKSPSTRSLASQYSQHDQLGSAPPMPPFPGGYPPNNMAPIPRNNSLGALHAPQPRPLLPSAQPSSRSVSMVEPSFDEPSPPNSPVQETPQQLGPVTSTISAQMKCKVFLQQHHAQWKSLGSAKLKLYHQSPTNIKQLVVEADNKDKSVLISTIVLTDGVERVGKTGIAIELSDKGARTGIVYMIQLRNDSSANGLFDSLLAGSDRAGR